MFCSECGKDIEANQSFCRSCGRGVGETDEETVWLKRAGTFGIGAFLGLLVIFVGTILTMIFPIRDEYFYIFFVILSVILFGIASALFFEKRPSKNRKKSNKENLLESNQPTPQLPQSNFEPIPSVTEATTNLLFTEVKRKTSGELK